MNKTNKLGTGFDEFALKIYQKESNQFVLLLFWFMVFIQFPVGAVMSYFHLFYLGPMVFILNALLTMSINVLFSYFIKRNIFPMAVKYLFMVYFLIFCGEVIYIYLNDVAMHMIWIGPIIIATLYLDRKLFIFTLGGSLLGLIVMDLICPITLQPDKFYDLFAASLYMILVLIVLVSLSHFRVQKLKRSIDSTTEAIIDGTSLINHTIKNEINKIAFCAFNMNNLLKSHDLNTSDYNMLRQSTDHLLSIIENVQGKIRKINLDKKEIDIGAIITNCLDSFAPQFEEKNIRAIKKYNDNLILTGDPIHIQELLNNLIVNAIEAIPSDKKGGVIEITAKNTGKSMVINLRDNGKGIPKEYLPRVIDPYFSTKENRTKNYGLGLTYCYNVMREHGGNLDIESETNHGTSVTLRFPMF